MAEEGRCAQNKIGRQQQGKRNTTKTDQIIKGHNGKVYIVTKLIILILCTLVCH